MQLFGACAVALPSRIGPGTASSLGTSAMLSCRFAPVMVRPSGVPRRSVTQCLLVPARPLSVGFGPVSRPSFRPNGRGVQRGAWCTATQPWTAGSWIFPAFHDDGLVAPSG